MWVILFSYSFSGNVGLWVYLAILPWMYTSIVALIVNSLFLLYNILVMNSTFYQNLDLGLNLGLNLHSHLLSKFSLLLYFQYYFISFGICFLDYLFIYYYIWLLHPRVLLANWFYEWSLVGIFFRPFFFMSISSFLVAERNSCDRDL